MLAAQHNNESWPAQGMKPVISEKTIPVPELVSALHRLPKFSDIRLGLSLAFLTGCRISEFDLMRPDMIDRDSLMIYWYRGKNQSGLRKAPLTVAWLAEYDEYRAREGIPASKLFGMKAHSLRRKFNFMRQFLGGIWMERAKAWRGGCFMEEYAYQLRFLRKNYQTLKFYQYWEYFKDASVALEFVCKDMGHSNKGMTVTHYIEAWESLGLISPVSPAEILRRAGQQEVLLAWL